LFCASASKEAAERAGISEHQRKQAVRVANVPREQFDAAVESETPPTVTALAEMGKDGKRAADETTFPVYFGSCHGGRVVTERTSTKTKEKADPAKANANRGDPLDLIASFAAQVRADGLDLASRIGPRWPTLVERLREVIDEIELEVERREKEAHQSGEMPPIPDFLRRSAP
jgi:hypothetical protein